MDRRDFLKQAAGAAGLVAAVPLLPGCGNSTAPAVPVAAGGAGGAPVTNPVFPLPGEEPKDFDYPLGLALPFAHGVASGDPLSDRVILWTRITEITPSAVAIPVRWEVASDPQMTQVIRRGTQNTVADRDWTVKVDVTGLSPATSYYYRFSALGATSITGRTRTAPSAAVDNLRFAVLSCSSYWSSYWSGYHHIARRNDLDLVVHCGDYIYDFIDQDEFVRSRKGNRDLGHPDQRDWLDIAELRRRYALWRSDENLLRAHQQHPFFIVWDNHDLDEDYGNELATPQDGQKSSTTLAQTTQVFWEWTPSRPVLADGSGRFLLVDDGSYPSPQDTKLVWRKLPYGPLCDVFGVDTQIGLPGHGLKLDASHLPAGTPTLYGRTQFEWITGGLLASQQTGVRWRFINNQTWFAPVDVPDVTATAPLPKIGISRWTNYPGERTAFCEYLRGGNPASTRVHGTIVVSGDAHGNLGSDLIESPALLQRYASSAPLPNPRSGSTAENTLAGYMRAGTGNVAALNNRADSVGVEFAPTSMGRGGADELVSRAIIDATTTPAGPGPTPPFATTVAGSRALEAALIAANRNIQFIEWVDHGYGIVDIKPERAIFEYWWQDKLTPGSPDVLGQQMVSWAADDASALPAPRFADQIDAVTLHGMAVSPTSGSRVSAAAPDFVAAPR